MNFHRSLLILAFIATAAYGQTVEISPISPTANDTVSITFTTPPLGDCGPTDGEVTFTGKTIQVRLFRRPGIGECPPDVRPRSARVELGRLAIGDYRVFADYHGLATTQHWEHRFVVRSPFNGMSVMSTSGGIRVNVAAGSFCGVRVCDPASVLFGGVPALSTRAEGGWLSAVAPPHAAGLYDIKVISPARTQVTEGAVYYFDRQAPPDHSVFEPVLFPLLDSVQGAFGSRWTTTGTIINELPTYVETFNRVGKTEVLSPHEASEFAGTGFRHGVVLYVPRTVSNLMTFGLRITEGSRLDDPDIHLPPVRESDFGRFSRLVNVPVGPTFRTRVRIYALDRRASAVWVSAQAPTTIWMKMLPIKWSEDPMVPGYAEIDLQTVTELAGHDRVTLRVSASWAFASVVSNATQRMSIITLQQ